MNSDESSCQNSHILVGCLIWIEKHLCLDSEENVCAKIERLNVQICSHSFETLANALVTLFQVPFPFTFLTQRLGSCL